MSASNEDELQLASDQTPALLTASLESMARQVPDVSCPELPSSGCDDAREVSAAIDL